MDESRARTCVNFSTTTNSNKYLGVYTFEYSRVNGNAREVRHIRQNSFFGVDGVLLRIAPEDIL